MSTSLRRTLALLLIPTAVALLAAPASAATASPQPVVATAPTVTTQGIIMSDGRICNPRWGC